MRIAFTPLAAAVLLAACGAAADLDVDAMPGAAATPPMTVAEADDFAPGERSEPAAAPVAASFVAPEPPATAAPAAAPAPHGQPIDHAARTRLGLYATRAEATTLDHELRGQTVWFDAGCCSGEDLDLVVLLAFGEQAAKGAGNDAPFFVTGADLRLAARIVDRLVDAGVRRAYLVTTP